MGAVRKEHDLAILYERMAYSIGRIELIWTWNLATRP